MKPVSVRAPFGMILLSAGSALLLWHTPVAMAQPAPGQFAQSAADEVDKPGVAEEAPKPSASAMPTTPVLPPPDAARKRWKLFHFDGFFRFRYDWQKNFHMGFLDDEAAGGAPYPRSGGCVSTATSKPCSDNRFSGNMKLRLNPGFAISEGTGVFSTIDVLDNTVLGDASTNDAGIAALGEGQGGSDAIVVRRLWAEVATPLGLLKVGRMPEHWGAGMMFNAGDRNEITGERNFDAEGGDTVDRLSFATTLPRSGLRLGIANDWAGSRLTSKTTDAAIDPQPFDLEDGDDVNQWVITVTKINTPVEFNDSVARGLLTYNWGVRFAYRTQSYDYAPDAASTLALDPDGFVLRGYTAYVPGAWGRVAYKAFELEAEAGAHLGSISHLTDVGVSGSVGLRQWGGLAKLTWRGAEKKLMARVEVGTASGDDHDNTPQGSLHVSKATWFAANDSTQSRFVFDPNYQIDMILFRKLFGAVTNATYFRPSMSYDLTSAWRAQAAGIMSFANRPVATPGNASFLATEFNLNIGYHGAGFEAGLGYGVLFPFEGLAHPADDLAEVGPGFNYGAGNTGNASTAHALQARLILSF